MLKTENIKPVYETDFVVTEGIRYRCQVYTGKGAELVAGGEFDGFLVCTDEGDPGSVVPFDFSDTVEGAIKIAQASLT